MKPPSSLELFREDLNRGSSSSFYHPGTDINAKAREFLVRKGLKMLKPGRVLEMGWMGPFWTDKLLERGCEVDIVEAADLQAENARKKYSAKGVRVFQSLFEEFSPREKYDTIYCTGVLKHCLDPLFVLRRIDSWLGEDACLVIGEPNARSFNRRLGALMGILKHPAELTENDRAVKNRKIFDRYELSSLVREAGYDIRETQGVFFKPFDNQKMNAWAEDQRLLEALDQMGGELMDYAWYLLFLCKRAAG